MIYRVPSGAAMGTGPQMSPRRIKVGGWMAVCSGVLLVVMMGGLTGWFAWLLWQQQHDPDPSTRFTGGPVMAALIMGLFVFLLAFGVVTLRGGIHMLRYGQRDTRVLTWIPALMGVVYGFWILAQVYELVVDWIG